MFSQTFDRVTRRLHLRYAGFWTVEDALHVQSQFKRAIDIASAGGPFTLLDDLTGWGAQTQEVVEINRQFVELCRGAPILRSAMVVPSALVRMQVQRTLDDMDSALFPTFEEADAWLKEVEPNERQSLGGSS